MWKSLLSLNRSAYHVVYSFCMAGLRKVWHENFCLARIKTSPSSHWYTVQKQRCEPRTHQCKITFSSFFDLYSKATGRSDQAGSVALSRCGGYIVNVLRSRGIDSQTRWYNTIRCYNLCDRERQMDPTSAICLSVTNPPYRAKASPISALWNGENRLEHKFALLGGQNK